MKSNGPLDSSRYPKKPGGTDPISWIDDELARLEGCNLLRQLRVRESPHVAGLVQINGRQFIDFSSNDYLGLAADPRIVKAVAKSCEQTGFGSGASPLVSGYGVLHRRLERELAELERCEAVALCSTGYAANIAAITSVVGKGDCIWSDELNHASIIDGCRLSGADIKVFRHSDMDHLDEIARSRSSYRRALLVTDSLFSMDGDVARLNELVHIAEDNSAMMMIDEAHATGVFGEHGIGIADQLGLTDRIPIRVGTLSKALGGIGGFISGPQSVVDLVRNRARPYVFSTALPESVAAGCLAALDIVRNEPIRRESLRAMSKQVRDGLRGAGFDIGNSDSQIIPIIIGPAEMTILASRKLEEAGILVPAIRPPSVPPDSSRLRISLCSTHNQNHIQKLFTALQECRSILAI